MNQKGVPEPQAALDRVKIIENGEPLVDLRSIPLLSFRNEAKHTVTPYLRKSVAEMLAKAAERIPKEFMMHVISALRPVEEQKRIWQYHYDYNKSEHPDWPENVLRRAVNSTSRHSIIQRPLVTALVLPSTSYSAGTMAVSLMLCRPT